jgi:hypothetical protein
MIGHQLKVNPIEQRAPCRQCHLCSQRLGIVRVVMPLGTLQLAREETSKRRRTEVMPPLRRENTVAQIANALGGLGSALWDFLALIISLLPNLGVRLTHILSMVVMVFVVLYLFLSRGFGDYLVRSTQMAVIGFIFPNSSAVVKEF